MTFNQIINRIKTIALGHGQLNNFYYGSVTDFLEDKTTRYASCFLQDVPGNINLDGKTRTVNFTMFLLDLVNVSENSKANETDVQSDMMSIGTDMIALFNYSGYSDWKVEPNITFTLVREQLDDLVAGVMFDIAISVIYEQDVCEVPVRNISATVTIEWGYFENNPYMDIQDQTFAFSKTITDGLSSYALDFTEAADQAFLAVKEPSNQPGKFNWLNTPLNYGVIPDQVFRESVIIGAYRYYVSRIQVVLDSNNSIITFNV